MEASVQKWTLVQKSRGGAAAEMQSASEPAWGPTHACASRDGLGMAETARRSTTACCQVLAAATPMQPACTLAPGRMSVSASKGFEEMGLIVKQSLRAGNKLGNVIRWQPVSLLLLASGVVFARRAMKETAICATEMQPWNCHSSPRQLYLTSG